ncbi:MAG: hypothetical protein IPL33_16710 [Sphingobacteriales bacterium]|nr:hypothetical protein [Sphingobacteriales bacterium]
MLTAAFGDYAASLPYFADWLHDPSFDHTKPNNSDICARATACFDYTFESQEPAARMFVACPMLL